MENRGRIAKPKLSCYLRRCVLKKLGFQKCFVMFYFYFFYLHVLIKKVLGYSGGPIISFLNLFRNFAFTSSSCYPLC